MVIGVNKWDLIAEKAAKLDRIARGGRTAAAAGARRAVVPVSGATGQGLDDLMEAILRVHGRRRVPSGIRCRDDRVGDRRASSTARRQHHRGHPGVGRFSGSGCGDLMTGAVKHGRQTVGLVLMKSEEGKAAVDYVGAQCPQIRVQDRGTFYLLETEGTDSDPVGRSRRVPRETAIHVAVPGVHVELLRARPGRGRCLRRDG